jgi:hypothetical protein
VNGFSLNSELDIVTHAPLSGNYPDLPVCGYILSGETVTADLAAVTCRDCLAAVTW